MFGGSEDLARTIGSEGRGEVGSLNAARWGSPAINDARFKQIRLEIQIFIRVQGNGRTTYLGM